jgi:hypothetical protein
MITDQFPLPWSVGSYKFDIKASNGLNIDEICSAGGEAEDEELAAFICRSVNSHGALVSALIGMVEMYADLVNSGDAGFWDPEKVDEVKQARAALAVARGEA